MPNVTATKHLEPIECDGLEEKPVLTQDNRDTIEYQEAMAEDATELLVVFGKIIELARARGDIP